jgi:hypothetical protein
MPRKLKGLYFVVSTREEDPSREGAHVWLPRFRVKRPMRMRKFVRQLERQGYDRHASILMSRENYV